MKSPPASRPVAQLKKPAILLVALALVVAGMALWTVFGGGMTTMAQFGPRRGEPETVVRTKLKLEDIPFNGNRAYDYLKQLCAIGPRIPGSPGMLKQQELLTEHFRKLGGKVTPQRFTIRHPESGERVSLTNLIVEWHPEKRERILLAAHYDTRPYPDRDPDPRRRTDIFLGANDGASGTALLMELAHDMPKLDSRYGVDFVLFDGEELVYQEFRDKNYYFLGSTWFAQQYARQPPKHRYRAGVVLDMVADADLQLFQERASIGYPRARPLVDEIWKLARELGVHEFIAQPGHDVRDDHLPLNDIAKIPSLDIIDFDYPSPDAPFSYWHTTHDRPENCSALSLAKVGWVVREWLKRTK
jgi:hypothetical protein